MRPNPACVATLLLAGAACPAHAQKSAVTSNPCDTQSRANGWDTYLDRAHGFCFQYPSSYKRVPIGESQSIKLKRLHSDAYILVSFENKPFSLQRFVETAPSGMESPPSPIRIGKYTFYYYGPGGGGVGYPDRFFFNLRGETLYITFDGLYVNDKTPSAETKKLEQQLLATFRLFGD